MRATIPLLMLLLAAAPSGAAEDPSLDTLFARRGVSGTMVITSLSGETTYVHNAQRAGKRFSPASTFKIPHSLIALEERAIRDEHDTLRWDGIRRAIPAWNRDHTLASAFPASCVWFYQEIARRVGMEKERSYLKTLSYGNQIAGNRVDMFWLDGSLKASALEQILFLKGLYRRSFPFSPRSYDILQRVMTDSLAPGVFLRGKTGRTGGASDIGWYVGYVERDRSVWFFAANIDIQSDADVPLRRQIALEALKLKGILP